jgi:Tfp pilus assembly protein PilF
MVGSSNIPESSSKLIVSDEQGKGRRRFIFTALTLVVMTFIAYWPAIQEGGFVWDDEDYVIQNETLRDINGLKDIWTSPQATPQYYPLVHTGFWIEYQLWGLDPTGYHVTNVLLHALAAILLWRLLRWLSVPGAWLAATLFALHPVHVESVAWITERKNVLSGVFYLGAAMVYLKWADAKDTGQRRPWVYLGALLLFACALLSKTVTASLPAALLLILWWRDGYQKITETPEVPPIRRWLIGRLLPLTPFFFVGLAFSVITIWLEKNHVGAKGAEWDLCFIERCLIAGRALWFYIGKLLWPTELCFSYTRWNIDASAWWQYLYPLAFAALVISLWIGRKRLGRGPLVAVLFFAGSLMPALGFFDVYPMRYSFVADHFQYLASIGILVMVAAGITWMIDRLLEKKQGQARRLLCYAVPTLIFSTLLVFSWKQSRIYQNLETLWLDTIEKNPASWMAYNNLGLFYLNENNPEQAVPLLEKAIKFNPRELSAINNLGASLVRMNRYDEAKQRYQEAISTDPNDPRAYHNLGVALVKEGKLEQALGYYQRALEIDPKLASTHTHMAILLVQMGRLDEAIQHYKKALLIAPKDGTVRLNYGDALLSAGRVREAADHFRIAVSLDPSLAGAHFQLGRIALADQLLPAALEHYRTAVEHAPDFALAHNGLAVTLSAIGRQEAAAGHFLTALSLDPNSGSLRLDYANFLMKQGDKLAARKELLAAAELMPEDLTPMFQLGVLEQQLGDLVAAEAHFRSILKRAEHGLTYNHLAVLLASKGMTKEAAELLRRAVKAEPDNAEYYNNLGVILVRAGDHQEALKALEEAVRLAPNYAEAKKNLGDLRRLIYSKESP